VPNVEGWELADSLPPQIKEIPKSPSGKILRRVLRDKEKAGKFGLVVKDEARAKL
jgi:4-coumarate--CoA ligase